ncbi:formyltetrahydrofolate deformylase, partial [Arthrobacter deserti]|nr:formyltetrahydrofolate deformylase [Arthrobacter deserti]
MAPALAAAPAEEAAHRFALPLTCAERPGIVHAVTSFLLQHGFNIDEHQQFDDPVRRTLYLRTAFSGRSSKGAAALAD